MEKPSLVGAFIQAAEGQAMTDTVNTRTDATNNDTAEREAIVRYMVLFDPNYPHFGLEEAPVKHSQHPNQQKGLDLYVRVTNFDTGERCFKKLYENTRGIHFKHTGYSPMYIKDFTAITSVIPFQVLGLGDHLKESTHE